MSKSENRWFLIETGEGDVSITPFCEYKDARRAMSASYNNYKISDPEETDGTCWITNKRAYVDCPYSGWQRNWIIVGITELMSATETMIR